MLVPLQYAVLVGVGVSVVLHVVPQSNQVEDAPMGAAAEGQIIEIDPPADVPA